VTPSVAPDPRPASATAQGEDRSVPTRGVERHRDPREPRAPGRTARSESSDLRRRITAGLVALLTTAAIVVVATNPGRS
jgi:hypothetical protein